MYQGSCLCGAISFEITGPIKSIVCCHCSQCRKAQGTAFATNGIVASKHFRILTGEQFLSAYQVTPDQTRYFCKNCGSPIMSKNTSRPDDIRIRMGTIISDVKEKPEAHIFVSSKANWEDIKNDLPQYDSYEPGRLK